MIKRILPLLVALTASPALGWGHQAHTAIDRAAIAALPADGPTFLRAYVDYIAASSTVPDGWRNASEPFSKIEEDPNHGWFRERFAFLKPIPRSRYAFLLALYRENARVARSDPAAAAWVNVRWTGTLPYAVMEQYGHLVADMRQLRGVRAAGREKNAQFLEQICAFDVIRLGHYVGDGSQPLHDSINSDGWRGPNPHGYTTGASIHSRFESDYVGLIDLTEVDVSRHMAPLARARGDLFDAVLSYLDEAGDRMETVYQLDKRGAFAKAADIDARALVYARTGAGASLLRDLIVRAWGESQQSSAVAVANPLDPLTPGFDPTTGSAPAPVDPD
ncbi:nuclease [Sphingomonas sp. 10B4]|uniref:nuclease n=1 Tax=Sphingomonas sp. 10B4 TaxID=3048575 RepID=UPI002AB521A0|nr:nuclease [Sphingomonas sp. 10B4]MDY7524571.1 nuclease [Sphingomonas sp. 10B4]MEB0283989.1 nuclease [Sphingomonas sp. 10B4]